MTRHRALLSDLAEAAGVKKGTARGARRRLGVGEYFARAWWVNDQEWSAILAEIHDGPGRPRNP